MKGKGRKNPNFTNKILWKGKKGEIIKKMENRTFTFLCQKSLAAASSKIGCLPGGILCTLLKAWSWLTEVSALHKPRAGTPANCFWSHWFLALCVSEWAECVSYQPSCLHCAGEYEHSCSPHSTSHWPYFLISWFLLWCFLCSSATCEKQKELSKNGNVLFATCSLAVHALYQTWFCGILSLLSNFDSNSVSG